MRLFVALNFPDSVRRPLWDALRPLRERGLPVKWVQPDGIHLSVKFLGEVDDAREPELVQALRQAVQGARGGGEGIPVHIEGFGVFPDFDRPRVLWAGVEPHPALELLQHGVERAFAPLGFEPEGRAFCPHVTVGRTRQAKPAEFRGLEQALGAVAFDATTLVESVDLVQSTLGPGGPVYQVRQRGRLS